MRSMEEIMKEIEANRKPKDDDWCTNCHDAEHTKNWFFYCDDKTEAWFCSKKCFNEWDKFMRRIHKGSKRGAW